MADKRIEKNRPSVLGYIFRLILVALILSLTSFLTPGFTIVGLWPILAASVVITTIDYFAERSMGVDAKPFGRGIKGFLITAVILYITQYIVPNMNVSVLGAVLAAVVIGLLDAVIPGRVM